MHSLSGIQIFLSTDNALFSPFCRESLFTLQSEWFSAVRFIHESDFFPLNRTFFSANEKATAKQNNQSDFKVSLK